MTRRKQAVLAGLAFGAGCLALPASGQNAPTSSGGRLILPRAAVGSLDEIEAREAALADLWARGPYTTRHAMFVTRKANLYGDYEPRPTNVFTPGEAMLSYIEPVGYAWQQNGDRFEIAVTIDLEIATRAGRIVGGQKAFQTARLSSRYRVREFFLNQTLTLDDAEPGDYVVTYTLNDDVSGRSTRVEQPFTIKR